MSYRCCRVGRHCFVNGGYDWGIGLGPLLALQLQLLDHDALDPVDAVVTPIAFATCETG